MNLTEHDPHSKKIKNVTGHFFQNWKAWWRKHRPPIFSPPVAQPVNDPNVRPPGDDPVFDPGKQPAWRIAPPRSARGSGPRVPRTHMEHSNGARVYGTDYGLERRYDG